jgi:Carboxypeptidase regulatory-like domain
VVRGFWVLCFLSSLVPLPVRACKCDASYSTCHEVRASDLVFIGTVESIEPVFLSRWNQTARSSVRSLNDAYTDAQQHPSAAALNRLKDEYQKVFPALTPDDKRKLADANSTQAVGSLFYSSMDRGMRVRLKVKTLFKQEDDDDDAQKAANAPQKATKDDDDNDPTKKEDRKKDAAKGNVKTAKSGDADNKDEDSFDIWTAFGDCGVDFEAGETYLVYANSDEGTDYFFTSSCTRTRRLSDSGGDLSYLFFYKNQPEESARLEGFVTTNERYKLDFDQMHDTSSVKLPVAGAVVELQSDRVTRYAESDRDGRFLFDGLPKGSYNVTAFAKGYPRDGQMLAGPIPLRIEEKGCATQVLLVPKKDGN